MIKQYFPSPEASKWQYTPYKPPVYQRGQSPWVDTRTPAPVPVAPYERDLIQSAKKGLSIDEYRKRKNEVIIQSNSCSFQVGDTCYPTIDKALKEHGQCIIVGICRDYDTYGDVEWNDPPFILTVSPLSNRKANINCTVGWVSKKEENNEC